MAAASWGRSCCLCVAVVLLIACSAAQGDDGFITWDDLSIPSAASAGGGAVVGLGKARAAPPPPAIVVAQDGTGHSRTVQGAVDMVPAGNRRRVKIFVRPGVYRCVCVTNGRRSLRLLLFLSSTTAARRLSVFSFVVVTASASMGVLINRYVGITK
jgi:hypothetical protein